MESGAGKRGAEHRGATDRLPRLDVLRAVAIVLVLCYHAVLTPYIPAAFIGEWKGQFTVFNRVTDGVIATFLPTEYGYLGVALFFVISGFCIHLSWLRRGSHFAWRHFFLNRFFRLYPTYFAALVVYFLVAVWTHSRDATAFQFVMHAFMLHNVSWGTFSALCIAFWSLAVEVQFYLLYPALLAAAARVGLARCFFGSVVLNILIFGTLITLTHPWSWFISWWIITFFTWNTWILGALLAESYCTGTPVFSRPRLVAGISLLLTLVALHIRPMYIESYLLSSGFFAVVLEAAVRSSGPLMPFERVLVPVGTASYSIYLWHLLIVGLFSDVAANYLPNALVPPAIVGGILVVGFLSYSLLELRLSTFLKRLARPETRRPTVPAHVLNPVSRSADI